MAKVKTPTPQEIYRARREREEQEKVAFLPPGLYNHGNTCFMNSVLQGLFATRLLSDLIHFVPVDSLTQQYSNTLLLPQRSPLLTNRNTYAGDCDREWVNAMPVGDVFVGVMIKAWDIQAAKTRENLSPKILLSTLGKKYDLYLDFAQQDAHEFLRILLDAMRMEEFDVIKKRQPPPEKPKKGRRKTTIHPISETSEGETLISMVDMIFGGQLTSILVCQKCKHVSQTYEDFNDLSLSIKDDYSKGRKRNRLRSFAKKLTAIGMNDSHRASSVPPPLQKVEHLQDEEEEARRRSLDAVADDKVQGYDGATPPSTSEEDKSLKNDGWAKLGHRIGMSVGLAAQGKERKGRSKERRSRDLSMEQSTPTSDGTLSPHPSSHCQSLSPHPTELSTSPLKDEVSIHAPISKRSSIQRNSSPQPPKLTRAESEYLHQILSDVTLPSSSPFSVFKASGSSSSVNSSLAVSHNAWMKTIGHPRVEDCLRMFTAVEVLDGENMVRCRRCWKIANGVYHPRKEDDEDDEDNEDRDSPLEINADHPPSLDPGAYPISVSGMSASMSTPEVCIFANSDSHNGSEVSLPSTIGTSVSDSAVTPTPPGLELTSISKRHTMVINTPNTPGGMPIPSISEPDNSTPVTARPYHFHKTYESQSTLESANDPESTPSVSTSKDSLLVAPSRPARHTRQRSELDSTDESSEDDEVEGGAVNPVQPLNRKVSHSKTKEVIMRPAYKRYLIGTPPPVLVINLKRFQQINSKSMMSFSNGFKKLDDYVVFPEYLDLAPFLAPKREDFGLVKRGHYRKKAKSGQRIGCMYRLYAVVVHIGTMLGGHYISYVALPPSENCPRPWAYISDTVVKLASLEEVLKAKAYICMYERI